MGAKIWDKKLEVLKFTWDVAVDGGAVGAIALGNLPNDFIVKECFYDVETALTGGGSCTLGEDGAGDADGYSADMDAFTGTAAMAGALVSSGGIFIPHKVDSAKDGVQVTVATTEYTAGKIHFYFVGFQG